MSEATVISSACLLAVTAALAVAGCGGDDDDGETVSRDEYVEQVTATCERYLDERRAAEEPLRGLRNPARLSSAEVMEAAPDIAGLNDTTRTVIDDLEALPRPEADEEQLDEVFTALADGAAALDAADQAAEAGEGEAVIAGFRNFDTAVDSAEEAGSAEFGFDTCGGE